MGCGDRVELGGPALPWDVGIGGPVSHDYFSIADQEFSSTSQVKYKGWLEEDSRGWAATSAAEPI